MVKYTVDRNAASGGSAALFSEILDFQRKSTKREVSSILAFLCDSGYLAQFGIRFLYKVSPNFKYELKFIQESMHSLAAH